MSSYNKVANYDLNVVPHTQTNSLRINFFVDKANSTANTHVNNQRDHIAGSYNASKNESNSLAIKNYSYKGSNSIDVLDIKSKLRRSLGNDGIFLSHLI